MFGEVSFLIPFQFDSGPREASFHWIKRYTENMFPGAEICIGESSTIPFNKSKAVNNAAKRATRDILVLLDADIFCDPDIIRQSIALLEKSTWVIPYKRILKVSQEDTSLVLQSKASWPIHFGLTRSEYIEAPAYVGALNIIPRKCFEMVGGFDERFVGWGREDDVFSFAVDTLCGHYLRLEAEIYHLWHPFVGTTGNPNIKVNTALWWEYRNVYGDAQAMKRVIENRYLK